MREIIVPDEHDAAFAVIEILLGYWSFDDRLEVISKEAYDQYENYR